MTEEKTNLQVRERFNIDKPKTKDEKLVVELLTCLRESAQAFIKLNESKLTPNEMFNICYTGTFAFLGNTISMFLEMVKDDCKKQFIEDLNIPFNMYLDEIRKDNGIDK